MLPMLPIYISYFAGGGDGKKRSLINSLGFVLGFTIIFISLGAFAGSLGKLLTDYSRWVNIITGAIVLIFGLNYLGLFNIPLIKKMSKIEFKAKDLGFFSSILFGLIFSIGWTPCVGTFLGSALMLAASAKNAVKGILMLACFSIGLGIPFVFSAVLLDRLKSVFSIIKKNYRIVNAISGSILVIVGIAMMTGMLGRLFSL
jgi:cytochrome c-type biogenesis protein